MKKRISVRGIIINKDEIYFIHRIKNDEEYYVFPGGGLEEGETMNEGLIRELKEEINVKVNIIKELYKLEREESIEYYILCKHISGKFGISNGPEYVSLEYKDNGKYIPCSININNLTNYNIVPKAIKDALIKDITEDTNLDNISIKKFYL